MTSHSPRAVIVRDLRLESYPELPRTYGPDDYNPHFQEMGPTGFEWDDGPDEIGARGGRYHIAARRHQPTTSVKLHPRRGIVAPTPHPAAASTPDSPDAAPDGGGQPDGGDGADDGDGGGGDDGGDQDAAGFHFHFPNPLHAISHAVEGAVKGASAAVKAGMHLVPPVLRGPLEKAIHLIEKAPLLGAAVGLVEHADSLVVSAIHAQQKLMDGFAALATLHPRDAARLLKEGNKQLTQNPLWDAARTAVSFIPGLGTGVSAGMAAAAALGRGEGIKDVALSAARGAIPGGPAVLAAYDVGVGIAHGQSMTTAALLAAREQVPGGAIGRAAFDAGTVLSHGALPQMSDLARAAMTDDQRKVYDSAMRAAEPHLPPKAARGKIPSLPYHHVSTHIVRALTEPSYYAAALSDGFRGDPAAFIRAL